MYDPIEHAKQIKELNEIWPLIEESSERLDKYSEKYRQKWYDIRLPFYIDVSLNIGSTMFDFCFWQLPEVLSIGIFWIHLDIHVGGRR